MFVEVWLKLVIETKNDKNYEFIKMNVMAFQNLLTFKNCLKDYGCLNLVSINQIKRRLFETLLEIKNIKKVKTCSFCVLK
jgi:hypothetical protein